MTETDTKNIAEIITFWFVETTDEQKYSKDDEFDALIIKKYQALYWQVLAGETKAWRESPEGRLAEIIVLDQFARNMFRGDPKSFIGDTLALALARAAMQAGDDMKVPHEQREFFYMPFMHSESPLVHVEALQIFEQYGDPNNLKYEIMHKEIIDRFGRYPHRNEVLNRISTSEEIEFLKDNPGF